MLWFNVKSEKTGNEAIAIPADRGTIVLTGKSDSDQDWSDHFENLPPKIQRIVDAENIERELARQAYERKRIGKS